MSKSLIIRDIKVLAGTLSKSHPIKTGEALDFIETTENAYIHSVDGLIESYGPMGDCPGRADKIISVKGKMVLPSWCDSHTHIVYAKSREKEFVSRVKGKSYEEIAAEGGGILNSARMLRDTPEDELYIDAYRRMEEVIGFGTGAIEIKSGYGLSFDSEVKILKVISRLKKAFDLPIKATFLGAHAIPTAYKGNRSAYIDLIIDQMLPYIAEHSLADYCDVFCDKGFYTVAETDQILKAALKFGLKPKIHANELAISGGVQVGIANNAVSVDHLECMGDEEIEALSKSNTVGTMLPSTSFFLNIPYARARDMIERGCKVAIASDYNPGSTPSGKIPFLLSLACLKLKMTPTEAINAITINGAHAMELQEEVGSITKGKRANFIVTKRIPSIAYVPYAFGSDHIDSVFINGDKK